MPLLKAQQNPNFESNENYGSKVAFELEFLDQETSDNASWQNYRLIFHNGEKKYVFESIKKTAKTFLGTEGEIGKFALSIAPYNELEVFHKSLYKFLDKDSLSFNFEPADPSFEINIEKLPLFSGEPQSYKCYVWIDAGNSSQLEYTWDAMGLRFLTGKAEIEEFLAGLKT